MVKQYYIAFFNPGVKLQIQMLNGLGSVSCLTLQRPAPGRPARKGYFNMRVNEHDESCSQIGEFGKLPPVEEIISE